MAGRASGTPNPVATLYQSVINDVINNVRETFLDDGVDEQVLQELKTTWEHKVQQSKAIENPTPQHRLTPSMPVYVHQHAVMNKIMPVSQGIQLTPSGQQATIALPNAMAAKYQLAGANQAHLYAPYQPAQQVLVHQANTKASATTQQQETSNDLSQPSVLIQSDGASDICSIPCSSKNASLNLTKSSKKVRVKPGTSKSVSDESVSFVLSKTKNNYKAFMPQVDGRVDSSSDEFEDDDEDDDDDDDDDEETDRKESEPTVDDDPLCSDDDVGTDEDPEELFDTDNVIVCQYDKIHRTKCRWKFNLKLGIMNLNGRDMVFQKATGEAEW